MKTKEELEAIEKGLKEKGTRYNTVTAFLNDDNEEETATFFLRKPDGAARSLIEKTVNKDGGLRAIYVAIKNLFIDGDDPNILNLNDYALKSCDEAVRDMFEVKKAQLKKN